MKTLNALVNACREHPPSVGQTYWQHFRFSASMSMKLCIAAITALVHALIPGVFQKTTSRSIDNLHRRMHEQTNQTGTR